MTHCDRLLDVLSDGNEHDHLELYRLGMIVHSRVADLRKRGYLIEHRREQHTSFYRLVGRLDDAHREPQPGLLAGSAPSLAQTVEPSDEGFLSASPEGSVPVGVVEQVDGQLVMA